MFHKIGILLFAVCSISHLANWLIFGYELNQWLLLACALGVVSIARELQFDSFKSLFDAHLLLKSVMLKAISLEFGADATKRLRIRSLEVLEEHAPEECKGQAQKLANILKKMEADHADDAKNP